MHPVARTLISAAVGLLVFGALLFLPAGTLGYWQAWVFLAVFTVSTMVPSLYLAIARPDVLARRMRAGPAAETRPAQRWAITLTMIVFVSLLVFSALDHRFGWSNAPLWSVAAGNLAVLVGMAITQVVVLQNSFAGANIRVEAGQSLVSTGLYGIRHPMYTGGLILMAGMPLALGSCWGVLLSVAALPALVLRIRDEEAMLGSQLTGYPQYTRQVRYRLVPYLW